jgi:probable phosphoglycerate mutase
VIRTRHFIMRHGETVYNLTRRLQSNTIHTPLTRLGCDQATRMGQALRAVLGERPGAHVHVSDTGRTLQTLGLIAEEVGIDWFAARQSADLREIDLGSWCLRGYDEVEAEVGPIRLPDHLLRPAPDGEDYPAIAARLSRWLAGPGAAPGDHIVVMHGISSRVLRGIMTGASQHPELGAPLAPSLVQGSIALVEGGHETILFGSEQGTEHA